MDRTHRFSNLVRAGISTALAAALLALCLHAREAPTQLPVRPTHVTIHGTVLEASDTPSPHHGIFTLRDDTGAAFAVESLDEAPPVGSGVTLRGRLAPFDQARNPGESDPQARAREQGLQARIIHAHLLEITPPDPRDPRIWPALARAWAGGQVRARIAEPYASILAGALWGERGALPPDLRAEFQDTGTVHILVTAGLHLGVIAALTVALLTQLEVGRVAASLITIPVVWAYALLSGGHLPSMRAATMASYALAAHAVGREALSWNALAAAAIITACALPQSVFSLSFALSFSCVAAILLFAPHFTALGERTAMPHFASEAVALTLATQIGTWPLTAKAFLLFAPYAPLANLLIVPTVGIVMMVGMAQLLAAPIDQLAQALANINGVLLAWIVGVVRTISAFPHAHIVVTPPPTWSIILYDAALLAVARLLTRGKYRQAALLFTVACALVLLPPRSEQGKLIVTAIDVGQADALLIRTPKGHAFLVDAGGRLERGMSAGQTSPAEAIGERIVEPFLIRQGVRKLDAILLSHPHGDHAGGAAPIIRTLGADAFADSGQSYPGHAYHDALKAVAERRVPVLQPREGEIWRTDDHVTFRFYNPSAPYLNGTRNDINNNSLVFRLEYGRFSMLFTGDAGAEAEERMAAHGDDLRALVLKVGHHGSAYSSTPTFLRAVSPRIAIISVGRENLFGHPARRTLLALQAVGARIYRTDQDGAITLKSNGTTVEATSFLDAHKHITLQAEDPS